LGAKEKKPSAIGVKRGERWGIRVQVNSMQRVSGFRGVTVGKERGIKDYRVGKPSGGGSSKCNGGGKQPEKNGTKKKVLHVI